MTQPGVQHARRIVGAFVRGNAQAARVISGLQVAGDLFGRTDYAKALEKEVTSLYVLLEEAKLDTSFEKEPGLEYRTACLPGINAEVEVACEYDEDEGWMVAGVMHKGTDLWELLSETQRFSLLTEVVDRLPAVSVKVAA